MKPVPIHLFAQFWYHTRHIDKMGFLEKIIVTPSHHRVHHAINKEYIDKNYGQIFIFWDKWFGTFQEEIKGIEPVYGITRPVQTWNPIKINFIHLWLMIKDAWHTKNWKDKFRIWFMPTGWRPADVSAKYPVFKIQDVYHFEKYDTRTSTAFNYWIYTQLAVGLLLVSYLFANIAKIGSPGMFYYGLFVFLFIYAMTELMDRSPYAWVWEIIKSGCGIGMIVYLGSWFGLSVNGISINFVLITYLIISALASIYFSIIEEQKMKIPS
jgi:hypothetical protein